MPTLEIDSLVKKMTKAQKRAMLEALVRELLPKGKPTKAERLAADKDLKRRYATRHKAISVEKAIRLSKV
jgi:hypothetical protein